MARNTSLDFNDYCARCGKILPKDGRSIYRTHCSRGCYMADYRDVEKQGRLDDKASRAPCAYCGGPVSPARWGHAIYCSAECKQLAWKVPKTCPHCGKAFRGKPDQVHCSWFCYCQVAKRKHRPRPCQWCGTTITQPHGKTRFCSLSCAGKAGMDVRLRDAVLTAKTLDLMLEKLRPKRAYRMRLTPARLDRLLARASRSG